MLRLKAGGSEATENMPPGHYILECRQAHAQDRGRNKVQVVLSFQVSEEFLHDGVVFKQWFTFYSKDGTVSPHTKYGKACSLALGRPIEPNDDLTP